MVRFFSFTHQLCILNFNSEVCLASTEGNPKDRYNSPTERGKRTSKGSVRRCRTEVICLICRYAGLHVLLGTEYLFAFPLS